VTAAAGQPALRTSFEHEHVELFRDPRTGLTGIVAIHSTAMGPAMGGLRIRAYADLDAALADALRLSRAMTLKNAAAGLDLGGGKAVLVDDGAWERRADRLRFAADVIERLGGRYVTAEDVGTSPADMDVIGEHTRWVAGRSLEHGGRGDPSAATARTVFGAIERAVALQAGAGSLEGAAVGVLGAGKVGGTVVALLAARGAEVLVADIDAARAGACAARTGARAVALGGFVERELDVLAPCAFGELIGLADVPRLRCRVIAGAANNPLVDRATAIALAQRDILYVPDFIANCGGIIHVGAEFLGFDDAEVDRRVRASVERVEAVLRIACESGELPLDVAERRALARLEAGHARPQLT
jgi:glutamate dehydrogenase/leucine dehydrogenase